MQYKIIFSKPYNEMTDQEISDLASDFKNKFVAFYADLCGNLSIIDAVLEYADRYSIDERVLGEIIQKDRELTSRLKTQNRFNPMNLEEEW